jgi:NosR/NirI family transcriptional regulator, nitrous oxide reductase regulator
MNRIVFLVFILLIIPNIAFGVQRFPPPEFETGHQLPITTVPNPRSDFLEYLDVVMLLMTLSLASYLAIKKRSRRSLFFLGIFSLLYFGFWRKGCVCPIGAIQNISLALFDKSYIPPITVIAFFVLPLAFTLFFGRTFCASVCPLGAIQDILLIRPIKVPSWVDNSLGLLAYIYFGAGVLFSATGSAFIICQYDPFVSFFRRSGSVNILIIGVCFLVIGMFIGRPYCRYLCPYSILLRLASKGAKWHVNITPNECINCHLCADSCPFGAIKKPTLIQPKDRKEGKKAFTFIIILLPVLIILGALLGVRAGTPLSHVNPRVRLAERVWMEDTKIVGDTTESSVAFRGTGRTKDELYAEAIRINGKFVIGGGIFGGFVGLVIGSKLILLFLRRRQIDYEADRASCLSCGRCFAYCPVGKDITYN